MPAPVSAPAPAPQGAAPAAAPASAQSASPAPAAPVNGRPFAPLASVKQRASVTLNADGTFDFDSMREQTRERILRAVKAMPASATTASAEIDPDWVPIGQQLAGLLGVGAAMLAEKAGYPREQAQALLFTPSETQQIAKPAAKVLHKHFGRLEQSDEAVLALAIIGVMLPKIAALKKPATVHAHPSAVPRAETGADA